MTKELYIHNTLHRKKELFKPIDPKNVRFYFCGPTVYGPIHIGNARAILVFDLLHRLLKHVYGEEHVTYVRNITDVDDKINALAAKANIPIATLTTQTIELFHQNLKGLGTLPPDHEPRATQYIPQMLAMITKLIELGKAYEAEGHVLFHVPSHASYGELSNRNLEEMQVGARVEVAPYKRSALDFVLWKPAQAGEPGWESPFGFGRPGWHIECSAMSAALLGEEIDIHCGGLDLIFPHHENEIAQSCAAHGRKIMANYWMHNGMLNMGEEKMSKSLGNIIGVSDLLASWPGEVVRLMMYSGHYRQPMTWLNSRLKESQATLQRWFQLLDQETLKGEVDEVALEALLDDLNTPMAIARLHEMAGQLKQGANGAFRANFKATLALMGFDLQSFHDRLQQLDSFRIDEAVINQLLDERKQAREAKNFKQADEIRDQLLNMGVEIEDSPAGTSWKMKR